MTCEKCQGTGKIERWEGSSLLYDDCMACKERRSQAVERTPEEEAERLRLLRNKPWEGDNPGEGVGPAAALVS